MTGANVYRTENDQRPNREVERGQRLVSLRRYPHNLAMIVQETEATIAAGSSLRSCKTLTISRKNRTCLT